ncbi:MAG TPA: hypothetical protein VEV45_20770 [Streptosporangiaceae bacterium]|nr:hypothetical protein [Streptosporangiaceae bacterium]
MATAAERKAEKETEDYRAGFEAGEARARKEKGRLIGTPPVSGSPAYLGGFRAGYGKIRNYRYRGSKVAEVLTQYEIRTLYGALVTVACPEDEVNDRNVLVEVLTAAMGVDA